jgi:hypothetical protein
MQIHRQTSDFGPLARQIDRTTTTRSSAFDAILARETSVRRQDLAGNGTTRQNVGGGTPTGRGDAAVGNSRLNGLNPALISRFPVPSTPPTVPPSNTTLPASPTTPASTPASTAASTTTTPAATTERHPAMTALRSALTAMGMPFAGIDMEYSEQTVGYPGGSYVNRLITVRGADGRTENFDADMTLRNPQIAAVDMANFLRGNG